MRDLHAERGVREVKLLNDKMIGKPPVFNGDRKRWKSWSRAMAAIFNGKYTGARKLLN